MAVHDKSEEYCYPTKCPECGKDVFRGLYNGGIYWVESLGDPWPNHPCFRSAVRPRSFELIGTCNAAGRPQAFFILKLGHSYLVRIVVEGPQKGRPRIAQI